jgi:tripartite-type tricarboxylate transporter receptor subunit TctC
MRRFATLALLLSTLCPASASDWPTRPITLVVGFAAGGGTDILARIVAKQLSTVLKQQVVIENVGGAGGMVGSLRVVKASPDGYTILLGSRADAINQTLYKRPAYNLLTDLIPVALVAEQPTILVVRNEFPANSMPEFIDYVTKNQSTMQFGSAGTGSTGMIDCALMNSALGVSVTHVPYRGGSAVMQDIIGGRIDYLCTLLGSAVPLVLGKSIKAIAVLTKERAPMLREVMSSWEQGFKKVETSTWFGLMLPKGTPADIVKKLSDATSQTLDDPEVQKQLFNAGAIPFARDERSAEYFKKFIPLEIEKNGAPLKAAGISED